MNTDERTSLSRQILMVILALMACGSNNNGGSESFARLRAAMVREQIESRGVTDKSVLRAMGSVPRHMFVPRSIRRQAYADHPLPIGHGQTISQPYIVAYMTEALAPKPGQKILEIGTGSGYQAAVLAELGVQVYSIEIVEPLATQAAEILKELGYSVKLRVGDGYAGWPEAAPFDGIIVTAAPPTIPSPLVEQLAEGGRLVVPVGRLIQDLKILRKIKGKLSEDKTLPVRFVPMTGRAQKN